MKGLSLPTLTRAGLAAIGLAVALLAPAPRASALDGWLFSDDCAPNTRCRRCEWDAAHRQAKMLGQLDCCGLGHYTERTRFIVNTRYLSLYNRPYSPAGVRPAPAAPTSEKEADADKEKDKDKDADHDHDAEKKPTSPEPDTPPPPPASDSGDQAPPKPDASDKDPRPTAVRPRRMTR